AGRRTGGRARARVGARLPPGAPRRSPRERGRYLSAARDAWLRAGGLVRRGTGAHRRRLPAAVRRVPDHASGAMTTVQRLRILYVADSLMAGGIESQLVELALRLDQARFEPHVL